MTSAKLGAERQKPWVYVRSEPNLWTVGFYDPAGKWHSDSDHDSPTDAAERVGFLSGGGNSFAALSAMNEAMRAALSRIRIVVKYSSHTAGALSTIRAAIDALPPEVWP